MEAAAARLQRVLDCLDRAGAVVRAAAGADTKPVRDDLDAIRVFAVHSGVALTGEQLDDFRGGEPRGHRDAEGHHDPGRIRRP